jgi:hypothetical protein
MPGILARAHYIRAVPRFTNSDNYGEIAKIRPESAILHHFYRVESRRAARNSGRADARIGVPFNSIGIRNVAGRAIVAAEKCISARMLQLSNKVFASLYS